MEVIKNSNLGLAFFLELFAVGVVSYWGFTIHAGKIVPILIGIAAPVLFVLIWGFWCAPTSSHRLDGAQLVLFKLLLFALVTFCLASRNHSMAALLFAILILSNLGISAYFGTL